MRVVLDTNVVVSGFLNPYGPPGALVGLAASGEMTLCYDARILSEYREVLSRPKFALAERAIEDFLAQVEAEGEPVAAPPLPHRLPDRDDEPFLAVALAANADCLVTGNHAHFPARLCLGMRVLSPAGFLDVLGKRR